MTSFWLTDLFAANFVSPPLQPVEGMLHGSPTIPVVVADAVLTVDIPYDTGIR